MIMENIDIKGNKNMRFDDRIFICFYFFGVHFNIFESFTKVELSLLETTISINRALREKMSKYRVSFWSVFPVFGLMWRFTP